MQDTANQAISKESSLSTLSPLVSPIPTLQQTFPLYISSAETYSHLLSSDLVPTSERETIRKRWRLVLGRAEKVKQRIEQLGGKVGKVDVGDEGLEAAVKRRAGAINGLQLPESTSEPSPREFEASAKADGVRYREGTEPEMPEVDVEWTEIDDDEWDYVMRPEERWTVRQGTGADCSVAAGLGVCIEHNRTWNTNVSNLIEADTAHGVRGICSWVARFQLTLSSRLSVREWKTCRQVAVERGMATNHHRRPPPPV